MFVLFWKDCSNKVLGLDIIITVQRSRHSTIWPIISRWRMLLHLTPVMLLVDLVFASFHHQFSDKISVSFCVCLGSVLMCQIICSRLRRCLDLLALIRLPSHHYWRIRAQARYWALDRTFSIRTSPAPPTSFWSHPNRENVQMCR